MISSVFNPAHRQVHLKHRILLMPIERLSKVDRSMQRGDRRCYSCSDIPAEKRDHFLLETGKVLVPVDSELFNVGFASSSDVSIDGNLWLHERCLKWSIPNLDTPYDYDLIRTSVLNAAKEVRHRWAFVTDANPIDSSSSSRHVRSVIVMELH